MLVQDMLTGDLHEVPDDRYRLARAPFAEAPDLSEYDVGETVYDGLGNPVGVLPLLLAAKAPAIASLATKALPVVSRLFKMFGRRRRRRAPPAPMAPVPPDAPGPMHGCAHPQKEKDLCSLKTAERDTCTKFPAPQFYQPPSTVPGHRRRTPPPPPGVSAATARLSAADAGRVGQTGTPFHRHAASSCVPSLLELARAGRSGAAICESAWGVSRCARRMPGDAGNARHAGNARDARYAWRRRSPSSPRSSPVGERRAVEPGGELHPRCRPLRRGRRQRSPSRPRSGSIDRSTGIGRRRS